MKTQSTNPNNRLIEASKQIKDCIKSAKNKELEKDIKVDQMSDLESLILTKNIRKEYLDNVVIRPNLAGRKTVGALEIH